MTMVNNYYYWFKAKQSLQKVSKYVIDKHKFLV